MPPGHSGAPNIGQDPPSLAAGWKPLRLVSILPVLVLSMARAVQPATAEPAGLDDPRFRIGVEAFLDERPAEAAAYLEASLEGQPASAPSRRPLLLLLALAHHRLEEHLAFHAVAGELALTDDAWGRLAALVLVVDHLDRGEVETALRCAGRRPDGDLGALHDLATATARAAAGLEGTAPPAGSGGAPPGVATETEAELAGRLRDAEAALGAGEIDRAGLSFETAASDAAAFAAALDADSRARSFALLSPGALARSVHPLLDREPAGVPRLLVDGRALETRIAAHVLALLGGAPLPAAERPLTRLEPAAALEAPAPITAAEAALVAGRLEALREASSHLQIARRRAAEAESRREAVLVHLGALEADRLGAAAELAAASRDLADLDMRAAAAGALLDVEIAAAIRRAEAHVDSIGEMAERLTRAARAITALFPPPRPGDPAEPPHFDVHRRTAGRDGETLAGIVRALAETRAALPAIVASHLRGDRWAAVEQSLLAADETYARALRIAGPLVADPAALAAAGGGGGSGGGERAAALDLAERSAAAALVLTIGEVDRAACARAANRLALLGEAARFGAAEALYRRSRSLAGREIEGEAPPGREAALRRAAQAFESFVAAGPRGPGLAAALLRLMQLRQEVAEIDFERAMARYLAPAGGETGGGASPTEPPPVLDTSATARAALTFLDRFPDHPRADRALYNLAVLARDAGERSRSTAYFERLRDEHPSSPLAAEAALRIGDNHFEGAEFAAAEAAYALITDGGGPLATAALYKVAWCRLNRGDAGGAAGAFADLLERHPGAAEEVREDAETTLARCLADLGGAAAAERFFAARPEGAAYGPTVFCLLAQEMATRAEYPEAVAAARSGATRYAGTPALARLLRTEIEVRERAAGGPDRELAQVRLDFARRIGPSSPWFHRHGSDSLAVAAGAEMLRGADELALLAAAGNAPAWELPRAAYSEYVDRFPGAEGTDRALFMVAECEMTLGRPRQAAATYSQVATTSSDSERAHQAAYGAVVAWERARGPATAGAPDLEAELGAIDLFLGRHGGADPQAPSVLRRRGAISFAAGRCSDAEESFARVLADYPPGDRTVRDLRALADVQLACGRPGRAAETYTAVLRRGPAAAGGADSALLAETHLLLPAARFREAEALAERGEAGEAARAFTRVADHFPDFAETDLALFRAGELFAAAGQPDAAARAYERLAATHAESPNRPTALLRLAELERAAGREAAAARTYLRFAADHPAERESGDAMIEARELALAARDAPLIEEAARAYLARPPAGAAGSGEGRRGGGPEGDGDEILAAHIDLAEVLAATGREGEAAAELDDALAGRTEGGPLRARAALRRAELRAPAYRALSLTPPIEQSIEIKKAALAALLGDLDLAVRTGGPEVAVTGSALLGTVLADFGQALEESQVPADLSGADLIAYSQVLAGEADAFYRRAESAWRRAVETAMRTGGAHTAAARARAQLFKRYDLRYVERARVHLARPPIEEHVHAGPIHAVRADAAP